MLVLGWLVSSLLVTAALTRRVRTRSPESLAELAAFHPRDLVLNTSDGQELGAWQIPGAANQPCAVVLHGQGSRRSQRTQTIQWLAARRVTVLAVTHRAHGDSSGQTNDFGWSNRLDVIASVEHLEHEFPGRPIVILGQSLGAASAIFAAKELDQRVEGYFLEHPFKDLDSAVWCRLNSKLPSGADYLAYAGMRLWAPCFLPVPIGAISPVERIGDIPASVPVHIVTGRDDRHARLADVEAVFRPVTTHGQLTIFEGAGHVDLHRSSPKEYEAALAEFLVDVERLRQ